MDTNPCLPPFVKRTVNDASRPQALLAAQAAMHFVHRGIALTTRCSCSPSRLCHDAVSGTPGVAKGEREVDIMNPDRPMRIRDVPRVVRTVFDALDDSHDPVRHYLVDTPDFKPTRLTDLINYISSLLMYTLWVLLGVAWVINDGDSFIIAFLNTPLEAPPPSPIVKWLFDSSGSLTGHSGSYSLKSNEGYVVSPPISLILHFTNMSQRNTLIYTTQMEATLRLLGTLPNSMLKISALVTHPSAQRRGYASALVKMVTDEADRQNHSTYLYSSNHFQNLAFYEGLGFEAVGRMKLEAVMQGGMREKNV
ncbi:hypothetical protein BC629DRAFT_1735293 [Irpex lacteus]|nr:hypothetical protein BC629DRAFT_1735293 [Irpex lacteus]